MKENAWTRRTITRLARMFEEGFAVFQADKGEDGKTLYKTDAKGDGIYEKLIEAIETEGYGE